MKASRIALFLLLFSLVASAAPKKAAKLPPEELDPDFPIPQRKDKKAIASVSHIVEKLQETWDQAKTFQAEFTQTVTEKRLGTPPEESRGTVSVLKPSQLRWETRKEVSEAGKKVLVTDGIQILNGDKMYVIHDNPRRNSRIVDVYKNVKRAVDTRPLRFLAGTAKFQDLYTSQLVGQSKTAWEIKFTSRDDVRETLVAEVDKKSYLLLSLASDAADVRTRTKFSNERVNKPMDAQLFVYVKQPNDVVHEN